MPGPRPWHRPTACTRPCPARRSTEVPADLAVDSSRPKLVLLRPTDDAAAADVDGDDGSHYERVGVLDRPEPVCLPEVSVALPSFRREQARRRCTMLLRCLGGVAISTALIGLFPGHAPGLGVHRAHRPGRARAGRADGLRQGARGRAGPPPFPARGRRRLGSRRPTIRRRPATPAPGTTTTSRCPGPPPAERAPAPASRPGEPPRRSGADYSGRRRGCSSAGRALRSQCRGRGFESLHLHQKPRSEGQSGIPQKITFSDVSLRVFIGHMRSKWGPYRDLIRLLFSTT